MPSSFRTPSVTFFPYTTLFRSQFRGDLYYRLSVFTIKLPPLRERPEDMPLLIDHFVRRFNGELGKEVRQISPEAVDVLRRHPWPGDRKSTRLNSSHLGISYALVLPYTISHLLSLHDALPISVPRRPLLSSERFHDQVAAFAGTTRGHAAVDRPLCETIQR